MAEKEKGERLIRADVLQSALLDEIAGRLLAVQRHFEESKPEGIVEPIHRLTVTTDYTVVRPPFIDKKWFSITIVKEDDVELNVVVNTGKSATTPYTMGADEKVYDQAFSMPCIEDVMLWTNSGTCHVKVRGSR